MVASLERAPIRESRVPQPRSLPRAAGSRRTGIRYRGLGYPHGTGMKRPIAALVATFLAPAAASVGCACPEKRLPETTAIKGRRYATIREIDVVMLGSPINKEKK